MPLGIVAGILNSPELSAGHAAGQFAETYGLGRLNTSTLASWHAEAAGLVTTWLDRATAHETLHSANGRVRELGLTDFVRESGLLPDGLSARLTDLAEAIRPKNRERRAALAVLPTLTEFSRTSLLRGELCHGNDGTEAQGGGHALTHRRIDRRLGLPEGTTSNYARTRRDLVVMVVQHIASIAHLREPDAPPPRTIDEATEQLVEAFEKVAARGVDIRARIALTIDCQDDPELYALLTTATHLTADREQGDPACGTRRLSAGKYPQAASAPTCFTPR